MRNVTAAPRTGRLGVVLAALGLFAGSGALFFVQDARAGGTRVSPFLRASAADRARITELHATLDRLEQRLAKGSLVRDSVLRVEVHERAREGDVPVLSGGPLASLGRRMDRLEDLLILQPELWNPTPWSASERRRRPALLDRLYSIERLRATVHDLDRPLEERARAFESLGSTVAPGLHFDVGVRSCWFRDLGLAEDEDTRLRLMRAVRSCPPCDTVRRSLLQRARHDRSDRVRKSALEGLRHDAENPSVLRAAEDAARFDPSEEVRGEAERILSRFRRGPKLDSDSKREQP